MARSAAGRVRSVDLGDDVVEQSGVDGLREGIAAVVGLLDSEILLNILIARLDLTLGERLHERPCRNAKHGLALGERALSGCCDGGGIRLAGVVLHVATAKRVTRRDTR